MTILSPETSPAPELVAPSASRTSRRAQTALVTVLALLAGVFLGAIIIGVAGADPLAAYGDMLDGALGSSRALERLAVAMIPLVLLGIGYLMAYRVRFFTIGAQGSYDFGAILAGWLVLTVDTGPGAAGITLSLALAVVGGVAVALVSGVLYARYAVNPVIASLMVNYLIFYLLAYLVRVPLRNPNGFTPESEPIPDSVVLPDLASTSVHIGILLAAAAVPLGAWALRRTRWGFASHVVGLNESAARATGTPVARTILLAAVMSGALSGLAGGIVLLGSEQRLSIGLSSTIGFTAIVVALLGRSPVGVVPAAALVAGLDQGGSVMQRTSQIPSSVSVVIQAIIVLLVLVVGRLMERRR